MLYYRSFAQFDTATILWLGPGITAGRITYPIRSRQTEEGTLQAEGNEPQGTVPQTVQF